MAPSNQSRTIPNPPAAARLGILLVAAALLADAPGAGLAGAPPIKLLAFGDSLALSQGVPAHDGFHKQLERILEARGYPVTVIDASKSGDTTAGGLARLDRALAERPDMVLLELGINDGRRGIALGDTYRNLDRILTRLAAENLPVLLLGTRVPHKLREDYPGGAYTGEFDRIFPRLADKHGVALYPFFLDGVALDPALNQADGIHPNAAGVAVIVDRIVPTLEPLLQRIVAGRGEADG